MSFEKITTATVAGRRLDAGAGDCVHIEGGGRKVFRFVALVRAESGKEHVEVYGPLAPDGRPMLKAKHRALPCSAITAKVRREVPRSTYLASAGLGARPITRSERARRKEG